MRRFIIFELCVVAVVVLWGVDSLLREAHSQEKVKDAYPGFRPCVVDAKKKIDEIPFEAPPRPNEKLFEVHRGNWYGWYVNDKTGEYLYRNMGPGKIKIGFFIRDPKTGELKEIEGKAKP